MLTKREIERLHSLGRITIDPFCPKRLNPNSYNLQLGPKLVEVLPNHFDEELGLWFLDPERPPVVEEQRIRYLGPTERPGWILQPGKLYLGSTVERFGSKEVIACITGRSSYARNGLLFELSAGFGDLGFQCQWTLEVTCQVPNTILWCHSICLQGFFHPPQGEIEEEDLYCGKYTHQQGVQPSRLHEEK